MSPVFTGLYEYFRADYDTQTDRFLLLDVARYKYSSYWVKSKDLWSAVNTMDGASYRGFVVIKP